MREKERLRTALKKMVKDRTEESQQLDDLRSCQTLLTDETYLRARRLFAFYPIAGEVNIHPILSDALEHKLLALPTTLDNGELHFRIVEDFSTLRRGSFGICEPIEGLTITPTADDLMLVPALAYTREGQRLGRGKGYYDRYLALHALVPTVGMCRGYQLLESLPNQGWDRPVDRVLCEGIFY
ncbi:MAG: 5-formyltetrahydrofolate cyclo-ligase [Spirochaetales bacterium]|nr:5-formyltetrahydrofolate cyclo-ligase [Spirochaetales bacterium]